MSASQSTREKLCKKDRDKKRRALLARDGDRCCYCSEQFGPDLPPTLEHVIPRSQGGTWATKNLRLACGPCNNTRGDGPCPPLARERPKA